MKTAHTLTEIRNQIDGIDNQLLILLNQRAELALDTLALKPKGLAHNPERENHILNRIAQNNTGLLSSSSIKHLFFEIIKTCRQLQQRVTSINDQQTDISVQGIAGSFSEGAALQYCERMGIKTPQLHLDTSSQGVVEHINANPNSIGIMAINNDQGGLVEETIAALNNESYTVIDTIPYRVNQCLLAPAPCSMESVHQVVSHSQALRQCQHFLHENLQHCEKIQVADTALAAKNAAAGYYGPHVAVIASKNAAQLYGLHVLQEKIQSLAHNITLFLVITKRTDP